MERRSDGKYSRWLHKDETPVQTGGLIRKFREPPVDGTNFLLDPSAVLVPIINLEKCGPPSSNSHEIHP
jgi:hypothetical protein